MNFTPTRRPLRHQKAKVLAGVLLILFGVLFLAERMGAPIPDWVISWKTGMIAVGVVTLYRHYWQKMWGFVLIIVGGVFLLNDIFPGIVDKNLLLPIMIIVFGIATLVKGTNLFQKKNSMSAHTLFESTDGISSDEIVETSTYFGGTKKNVVSKSFKGGNFVTAFGGTEVNLTKAEVEHPIEIKSNTAFGELKLIVPAHWQVRSEITCMFGGVDDNRSTANDLGQDESKIVTLTGNCLFGEVKIISY